VNPAASPRVFRLPRSAYLVVLFLLLGSAPLALANDTSVSLSYEIHRSNIGSGHFNWRLLILLIPILATVYIARTATFVTADGLRVRALLGSRRLRWSSLRGLSVDGRSVYAVISDGAVRLPCVRVNDLAELSRASGGHVPQVRDPVRRFAPSRRHR
jgi:hypothetical protein